MAMMKRIFIVIFVSCFGHVAVAEGSLETFKTNEFLNLPEEFQVIYIAGILDGMSYMSYNYKISGHEDWAECVRTKTLGAALKDVLRFLEANPSERRYPLPWAVAKTIGQRSCAPK